MGHISQTGELRVNCRRLDAFMENNCAIRPDLIKIDAEGSELDILRGATRLLRVQRPILLVATHETSLHVKCIELLRRFRYHVESLDNRPIEHTDELVAIRHGDVHSDAVTSTRP
jgi:Methyltransferase FkbM domain